MLEKKLIITMTNSNSVNSENRICPYDQSGFNVDDLVGIYSDKLTGETLYHADCIDEVRQGRKLGITYEEWQTTENKSQSFSVEETLRSLANKSELENPTINESSPRIIEIDSSNSKFSERLEIIRYNLSFIDWEGPEDGMYVTMPPCRVGFRILSPQGMSISILTGVVGGSIGLLAGLTGFTEGTMASYLDGSVSSTIGAAMGSLIGYGLTEDRFSPFYYEPPMSHIIPKPIRSICNVPIGMVVGTTSATMASYVGHQVGTALRYMWDLF
jgi:hypothetical protein